MTQLLNGISEVFNNIIGVFKGISIGDILDIVILTFLIYKAVQLVRETHAGQLLKGIIFLVLIDILVNVLDMTMMKVILQTVWSWEYLHLSCCSSRNCGTYLSSWAETSLVLSGAPSRTRRRSKASAAASKRYVRPVCLCQMPRWAPLSYLRTKPF